MEGYEEVWFCDAEGGLVQHEALCKTFKILSVKRQGGSYELQLEETSRLTIGYASYRPGDESFFVSKIDREHSVVWGHCASEVTTEGHLWACLDLPERETS